MQIDQLEMTHKCFTEILRQGPNQRLERLSFDLYHFYLQSYDSLNQSCHSLWNSLINFRLKMTVVPQAKFSADVQKIRNMFMNFNSYPIIYFGAERIEAHFDEVSLVNGPSVLGTPIVAGQKVTQYGKSVFNNTHASDTLPVSIFLHDGKWVAANNRELAAHCVGGARPLRLLPRLAQSFETDYLENIEEQVDGDSFEYAPNVIHLDAAHSLPSTQVPVMASPDSRLVEEVVTIPQNWF